MKESNCLKDLWEEIPNYESPDTLVDLPRHRGGQFVYQEQVNCNTIILTSLEILESFTKDTGIFHTFTYRYDSFIPFGAGYKVHVYCSGDPFTVLWKSGSSLNPLDSSYSLKADLLGNPLREGTLDLFKFIHSPTYRKIELEILENLCKDMLRNDKVWRRVVEG